jgi:hypothetical protein
LQLPHTSDEQRESDVFGISRRDIPSFYSCECVCAFQVSRWVLFDGGLSNAISTFPIWCKFGVGSNIWNLDATEVVTEMRMVQQSLQIVFELLLYQSINERLYFDKLVFQIVMSARSPSPTHLISLPQFHHHNVLLPRHPQTQRRLQRNLVPPTPINPGSQQPSAQNHLSKDFKRKKFSPLMFRARVPFSLMAMNLLPFD